MFNCITYVKVKYMPCEDEEYYLAGVNLDAKNCLEISLIEQVLETDIPKVVKENLKCCIINEIVTPTSKPATEMTDDEWAKEVEKVNAIGKARRKSAEKFLNKKKDKKVKKNAETEMLAKLTEMGLIK